MENLQHFRNSSAVGGITATEDSARVDDIYSASHLLPLFRPRLGPKSRQTKRYCITFGDLNITDAHYWKHTTTASSKNKYRPTLARSLASLLQIHLRSSPSFLVSVADLVSKHLHTFIDRIEKFESNVEILLEIETVRKIFLDIFCLLCFAFLGRPFEF